jgi:hypothetical protein
LIIIAFKIVILGGGKMDNVIKLTDYDQLLCIINSVQDFGVVGGMGDIVNNEKLAKVLIKQGCIIVKPISCVRRKRYFIGPKNG